MNKVNVAICTPGSSLTSGYVRSLLETIDELSKQRITWSFSNQSTSNVFSAREQTLWGNNQLLFDENKPFQGTLDYDKIIWIDSDISWTPDDFIKLYKSNKDVTSGAYLLGTGEVMAFKEHLSSPLLYTDVLNMKELVQIKAAGFGFLAVKQGIFESLSKPWFQSVAVDIAFDGAEVTHKFNIQGEDISWCKRVTDLGYEIWLDPTVRVTHHKTMRLTWEGPRV